MLRSESPRTRRLRTDGRALARLKQESTILDFEAAGDPAESYLVRFHGQGLWRPESEPPRAREFHEVSIKLGASYPRMMPELLWRTPIFHPNISAGGVVCLGGYGTHWAPSLTLDELCGMLWDMIRFENFDVASPYNRDAATWAKSQTQFRFPLDARPLRDQLAAPTVSAASIRPAVGSAPDVVFLEDARGEVVEAELIEGGESDILYIE